MATDLTNNKRIKEMYQNTGKEPVFCTKCRWLRVKFWMKLFRACNSDIYFCKHHTNLKACWNGMTGYKDGPNYINNDCDCSKYEPK